MTDKLHFADLTQITCAPGLLDDDTWKRLEAWTHGWEWWTGSDWQSRLRDYPPPQSSSNTYRARPAPREPVRGEVVVFSGSPLRADVGRRQFKDDTRRLRIPTIDGEIPVGEITVIVEAI